MTATASRRSSSPRRHWRETGSRKRVSSRGTASSSASRSTPAAVRAWRRVGANQGRGVGDGLDHPPIFQTRNGVVHRAPGPAGEGGQFQPVQEGHIGQTPQGVGFAAVESHGQPSSPAASSGGVPPVRSLRLEVLAALPVPAQVLGCFALLLFRRRVPALADALHLPAPLLHPLAAPLLLGGDLRLRREVGRSAVADAVGHGQAARLGLAHHHGEGRHPLRPHGGADVAVMHVQGNHVVLGYVVLAQLPHQLPGVAAGHLEHGQAAHVGQDGVAHGAGQVLQLGQALGGEDETGAELAQLRQHGLVIDAGHGLHLVHHDQRSPSFRRRQAALLPDHRVHQVEQRRAHQGGHVPTHGALGGGHQQDAALADGLPQVDGGAGLAQDGPGLLRGGVVGEAGLHRGQGVALVVPPPAGEYAAPPVQQEGVGDAGQHAGAVVVVGQQGQAVQQGELLVISWWRGDGWPRGGS